MAIFNSKLLVYQRVNIFKLTARSGLTPPTQLVVDRRFRGVPAAGTAW
jgi:hypothetical protein